MSAIVSTMFYLTIIVFVVFSPLIVPVAVTIVHAVRCWRERTASARAASKPALAPATAEPVPVAA